MHYDSPHHKPDVNTVPKSIPRNIHRKHPFFPGHHHPSRCIPSTNPYSEPNINSLPITSNKQTVLVQLSTIMNELKIKCNPQILMQQLHIIINEIQNSSEF